MTEILSLRPLLPTDEAQLRTFHEQLRADDFEFLQAEGTWADIIATHEREAKGIDLPPGRVRAEFLVAEDTPGRSCHFRSNDCARPVSRACSSRAMRRTPPRRV